MWNEPEDVEMVTTDEVVDAQKKTSEADALVLAGIHFYLHSHFIYYVVNINVNSLLNYVNSCKFFDNHFISFSHP